MQTVSTLRDTPPAHSERNPPLTSERQADILSRDLLKIAQTFLKTQVRVTYSEANPRELRKQPDISRSHRTTNRHTHSRTHAEPGHTKQYNVCSWASTHTNSMGYLKRGIA